MIIIIPIQMILIIYFLLGVISCLIYNIKLSKKKLKGGEK